MKEEKKEVDDKVAVSITHVLLTSLRFSSFYFLPSCAGSDNITRPTSLYIYSLHFYFNTLTLSVSRRYCLLLSYF